MDLKDIYTELILEHAKNPKNRREMEAPTISELGHNPSCGDEIKLMIKLNDGIIEDVSYTGHGCAISQASTSIMIDTIKRLPVDEAKALSEMFISMVKGEIKDEKELESLGDAVVFENIQNMPARVKCAVLPWYTLKDVFEEK